MSYNFLPYDQDQLLLLPPCLSDWVSDGSLARFVSDLIDQLHENGRLSIFYQGLREDGWGRASYHPRMMVKVLVYAYCLGITSSRRIARALENDVALRYLSANQQPDFRTINTFRKTHLCCLQDLFVEVLHICQEVGLAQMGCVALDGRRVAGNAALDQNRTKDRIVTEVERILADAERVDAEEDRRYGDARGDELPTGLRNREERLHRLEEARRRLEERGAADRQHQEDKIAARDAEERCQGKKKRGRKPKTPDEAVNREAKVNLTDPDSRILKTRKGWVQGYNGQAAADVKSQVIVAQDVTSQENDVNQLAPMLTCCEAQAGRQPSQVVADAGYWSEANAQLGNGETELFVATTKDWKQRKELREKGVPRGRIPAKATAKDRMERKLLTKRGRSVYRQRGSTIEAVFGQMVTRGLTRFVLRGIEKVRAEWSLWCTTHNVLKLWRSGLLPQAE